MRLVCPNCAATYEVPEDAIPDSGRDVQCASCGHAWFFQRPQTDYPPLAGEAQTSPKPDPVAEIDAEVAPLAEDTVFEMPPSDLPDPEPEALPVDDAEAALAQALTDDPDAMGEVPAPLAEADRPDQSAPPGAHLSHPSSTVTGEDDPEDADFYDEDFDDDEFDTDSFSPPAAAPTAAPPGNAYVTDGSVLSILREEAEREALVRRGIAVPLESQPELGVDTAVPDRQSAAALALAGDDAPRPAARRDLLPDVEEINSTLRPTETVRSEQTDLADAADRRAGFRSGFLTVMTIAMIGTGIYTLAPRLSVMVPALADPLATYVSSVDTLRLALDGVMRSATVALNGG